ncbi:GntR family transcriptional regulator [Sporomusa termitida]|uniref:Phosphonate utilization associated transcriptional regulator n=1 Tax=Sporomusa termitida TaxID=2377 RepID=A0A517E1L8_9FIRM|nr:GntR family transcriptional regulator [Sporomusa termitida]QDR83491.1 phosphonate utilization associated transcriptional regulator [Sporomusa termitida]
MITLGFINKLEFRTKQELVYKEIRRSIVNGNFAPGERLVITYLAKELAVSESPIREALKRLVSENFVVEQGNGLYVAQLSKEQFLEMLDVRLQLELIAIRLSAKYITDDGIQGLKQDLNEMEAALRRENLVEYYDWHKKFHEDCFAFCNVPYLIRALTDAADHNERGINIFKLRIWREKPDIKQHKKILNALEIYNANEAVQALELNRKKTFNFYIEQLTGD